MLILNMLKHGFAKKENMVFTAIKSGAELILDDDWQDTP